MRSARMDAWNPEGDRAIRTDGALPTLHAQGRGDFRCFLEVQRGMRHNEEFTWSYRVNLLRFEG
jgi:hypothetical protein